jgi:zinc protease
MKRILAAFAALALSAAPAATAQKAAPQPSTFKLKNGMQVVVVPDYRAPVVTHMVWYKVGAVDEDPGKSGLAHLFEHIMFKETDDIGPGEFDTIVQRNGGQLNAFTSWDYTAYYERVAKQHLKLMMELEAERMTDLIINDDPKGPFISERDVVKEERRQRIENNPGVILQEKVMAELWKGHPYEITVIGRMEEVAKLSPADGAAFYKKWYSPENAILVVAGDVTAAEVKKLAEETYGLKKPTGLASGVRKWRPVTPLTASQTLTHSDPKVRQPVWSRYYSGISQWRNQKEAYALDVAMDALGGSQTSVLYQALVERDKLAVSVNTSAWTGLHDEGPAVMSATPAPGVTLDALEAAVLKEVNAALASGLTDAQVKRSRNKLAASAIYERDSQNAMANIFGSTFALGGSIDTVVNYPRDIKAVTTADANAALRKVFGAERHYIESHLLPAEGTQ